MNGAVSAWKLATVLALVGANLVCAGFLYSGSPFLKTKKAQVTPDAKASSGNAAQVEAPEHGQAFPPDGKKPRRAGRSELPWARLDAALRGDVGNARRVWTQYLEACRSGVGGVEALSAELVEFTRSDLVPDYESALSEDTAARETALDCLEKAGRTEAADALLGYFQKLSEQPPEERSTDLGRVIKALTPYQDDGRVTHILMAVAEDPQVASLTLTALDALSEGGPPRERLEYFLSRLAGPVPSSDFGDLVGQECVYAIGRMAKRGNVDALTSLYAMARNRSISSARRKAAFTTLQNSGNLGGLSQEELRDLESLK